LLLREMPVPRDRTRSTQRALDKMAPAGC
jgi:hypothetical protein